MELYLAVALNRDNSYRVYQGFTYSHQGSVLIIDYNYTPWPRRGGNLLW